MPPVGNDIVDLKDPDNCGKSGDGRFIGRVFTPEEQARIGEAAFPDKLLWALWAAKEAAYKAVSRNDPSVCSTPRRYAVVFDDQEADRWIGRAVARSTDRFVRDGRGVGKTHDAAAGLEGGMTGRVLTPKGPAALWIIVTDDYVHALAISENEDPATLIHRVDLMDAGREAEGASRYARRQLLGEIAHRLKCPVDELEIRKEPRGPGAPGVYLRGRPFAAEISLSHDGRFTGFALRLPR